MSTPMRDEMIKALTGGRTVGRSSFGAMLHSIVEQAGSIRKAAPVLGVHNTTLSRWMRGATPKQQTANFGKVQTAYIRQHVKESVIEKWQRDAMSVTVVNVPGKGSHTRTLSATNLRLRAGTGTAVVNHFLAGNFAAMAPAFRAGIGDEWYRTRMFGDWMDDDDLNGEGQDYADTDYETSVGGIA